MKHRIVFIAAIMALLLLVTACAGGLTDETDPTTDPITDPTNAADYSSREAITASNIKEAAENEAQFLIDCVNKYMKLDPATVDQSISFMDYTNHYYFFGEESDSYAVLSYVRDTDSNNEDKKYNVFAVKLGDEIYLSGIEVGAVSYDHPDVYEYILGDARFNAKMAEFVPSTNGNRIETIDMTSLLSPYNTEANEGKVLTFSINPFKSLSVSGKLEGYISVDLNGYGDDDYVERGVTAVAWYPLTGKLETEMEFDRAADFVEYDTKDQSSYKFDEITESDKYRFYSEDGDLYMEAKSGGERVMLMDCLTDEEDEAKLPYKAQCVSVSGDRVAYSGDDGFGVYDASTGKNTYYSGEYIVFVSGSRVFYRNNDGYNMIDLESGVSPRLISSDDSLYNASSYAFSPDGKYLALYDLSGEHGLHSERGVDFDTVIVIDIDAGAKEEYHIACSEYFIGTACFIDNETLVMFDEGYSVSADEAYAYMISCK